MDDIEKDSRFSHILKDARFKKLPKKHVKVKVDKRFQSMFSDKKFQLKYKVDKRGRPVDVSRNENLEKYYDLSESDSGDSATETPTVSKEETAAIGVTVKKKLKDLTVDYARGEGRILSESSSEESSESDAEEEEFDHDWGELDKDAPMTEDATNRLAVCNMDWDRLKAVDLMVLFQSFVPPGGVIHSVTIYPSEFGVERMKEEEEKGPSELVDADTKEEDDAVQMERLRQYQLKRLKYFYGVMECDSAETANHIYKECDGLEYESSNNRLDLRFIPDGVTFDQEARESCMSTADLSTYKPKYFTTTALTQAKVELTWDETDPTRHEAVRAMHGGKMDDEHVRRYLACSSSEGEDDEEQVEELKSAEEEEEVEEEPAKGKSAIDKYKLLLAEIESKEVKSKQNEFDMEVSWDLKAEKKTGEGIEAAVRDKEIKTPFEKYIDKRKEKKKQKKMQRKQGPEAVSSDDDMPSDIDLNDPYFKEELGTNGKKVKGRKKGREVKAEEDPEEKRKAAELELLMLDGEDEGRHFNMKKIEENESKKKKKRKMKKVEERPADDFKVDVADSRFSAIYTSHHFNIDPSDPQFRKTKGTRDLIDEKQRRIQTQAPTECRAPGGAVSKHSAELSVLVKSVKRKADQARSKKSKIQK